MAVAFDAKVEAHTASASLSQSMTLAGGATYLLVAVNSFGGATTKITGVTWNSVAMTQIITFLQGGFDGVTLFGLASPTTGTHNIVCTTDGTLSGYSVAGISFTGAGGVSGAISDGSTTSTGSHTETVVSTSNSIVAAAVSIQGSGNTITEPTSATNWWTDTTNPPLTRQSTGHYKTGSTSTDMTFSIGSGTSDNWAYCAVSVDPPGSASTSDFFLVM